MEWLAKVKNKYKTLDTDYTTQKAALEMVADYLKRKGLPIYGGQALDMAFSTKNKKIYSLDELPDYDVLSSNFYEDAYDLADILYNKNFQDVKVVRAFHITTMSVRVDFRTVCDITYVPKAILDKIDAVEVDGFKIIGPITQRIELYSPFERPYAGWPVINIFHRWEKDLKRLKIMDELFPLPDNKFGQSDWIKLPAPTWISQAKGRVISGILALNILYNLATKRTGLPNIGLHLEPEPHFWALKEDKFDIITFERPKSGQAYYPIYGYLPEHYETKEERIWIYDQITTTPLKDLDASVVNIYPLIKFFLVQYIMAGNKIYLEYARLCYVMISLAETKTNEEKAKSPFWPNIQISGGRVIGETERYIFQDDFCRIKSQMAELKDVPRLEEIALCDENKKIPFMGYEPRIGKHPVADYTLPMFKIDGGKL